MPVRLREWNRGDIYQLAELANNKKIWDNVRDYFPHPYTIRHAAEWIEMNTEKKTVTSFAIESDGLLAGATGVFQKEDVYRCSAEIGYWIGEPFWGKGVATAAIGQLIEIIPNRFPEVIRVFAETFEYNKASMRVLEKNGFHLESIRKNALIKNGVILNDYVYVKFLKSFSEPG